MEPVSEICGYIATFFGTLLEGEISLLTSVLGAKMGYYNFFIAMMMAFLGAWIADWFKYYIGKTRGAKLLENKPKLQSRINKATQLFDKNPYLVLSFYKFFFGLTTVILITAGIKKVPAWRFIIHSGIAVILWVLVFGGLGFFCAESMISNIKMFSNYKLEILGLLIATIILYWLLVKRPYRRYCMEEKVDFTS